MKRVAATMCAVMMMLGMTACGEVAGVPNAQNPATATSQKSSLIPDTDPVWFDEEDQAGSMTWMALDNLKYGKWSDIDGFEHMDIDESNAVFNVYYEKYGKEASMWVTYDAATDKITAATISYGDVSMDALENSAVQVATAMLRAMEAEVNATGGETAEVAE